MTTGDRASLQTGIDYEMKTDIPGIISAEVAALYARGRGWLGCAPLL